MDTIDVLSILGAVVAAFLAGLLTVADALLTGVSRFRAQNLVDEERKGAERLAAQLARREANVQRVQLARLGCLAIAIAGPAYALRGTGAAVVALVLVVDFLLLHLFTVAIPRTWALGRLDSALSLGPRVTRLVGKFLPIRFLADAFRRLARRLVPGVRHQGPLVLPGLDDLDSNYREDGDDEPSETSTVQGFDPGQLLGSVMEFTRTVVREIMVPRTDMVTLRADLTVAAAASIPDTERYSRFPVEGQGIDDILGLVYVKDLMRAALHDGELRLVADLVHPARFVPENKRAPALLQEMQQEKVHMAIVVDEYGGTAGLVTLEDVLEELVGEIFDEFDEEVPPPVERLEDGRWRLAASALVADTNPELDRPLPEGDWDTVGGLVFDVFGRVPRPGESVEIDGRRLEVERVVGRRIKSVVVGPAEPEPASEGASL